MCVTKIWQKKDPTTRSKSPYGGQWGDVSEINSIKENKRSEKHEDIQIVYPIADSSDNRAQQIKEKTPQSYNIEPEVTISCQGSEGTSQTNSFVDSFKPRIFNANKILQRAKSADCAETLASKKVPKSSNSPISDPRPTLQILTDDKDEVHSEQRKSMEKENSGSHGDSDKIIQGISRSPASKIIPKDKDEVLNKPVKSIEKEYLGSHGVSDNIKQGKSRSSASKIITDDKDEVLNKPEKSTEKECSGSHGRSDNRIERKSRSPPLKMITVDKSAVHNRSEKSTEKEYSGSHGVSDNIKRGKSRSSASKIITDDNDEVLNKPVKSTEKEYSGSHGVSDIRIETKSRSPPLKIITDNKDEALKEPEESTKKEYSNSHRISDTMKQTKSKSPNVSLTGDGTKSIHQEETMIESETQVTMNKNRKENLSKDSHLNENGKQLHFQTENVVTSLLDRDKCKSKRLKEPLKLRLQLMPSSEAGISKEEFLRALSAINNDSPKACYKCQNGQHCQSRDDIERSESGTTSSESVTCTCNCESSYYSQSAISELVKMKHHVNMSHDTSLISDDAVHKVIRDTVYNCADGRKIESKVVEKTFQFDQSMVGSNVPSSPLRSANQSKYLDESLASKPSQVRAIFCPGPTKCTWRSCKHPSGSTLSQGKLSNESPRSVHSPQKSSNQTYELKRTSMESSCRSQRPSSQAPERNLRSQELLSQTSGPKQTSQKSSSQASERNLRSQEPSNKTKGPKLTPQKPSSEIPERDLKFRDPSSQASVSRFTCQKSSSLTSEPNLRLREPANETQESKTTLQKPSSQIPERNLGSLESSSQASGSRFTFQKSSSHAYEQKLRREPASETQESKLTAQKSTSKILEAEVRPREPSSQVQGPKFTLQERYDQRQSKLQSEQKLFRTIAAQYDSSNVIQFHNKFDPHMHNIMENADSFIKKLDETKVKVEEFEKTIDKLRQSEQFNNKHQKQFTFTDNSNENRKHFDFNAGSTNMKDFLFEKTHPVNTIPYFQPGVLRQQASMRSQVTNQHPKLSSSQRKCHLPSGKATVPKLRCSQCHKIIPTNW